MSSIAFTSPSGKVRVSGRERAMMGSICQRFRAMQMGDLNHIVLDWVEHVSRPGHYLHDGAQALRIAATDQQRFDLKRRLARDLETYLNVGDDGAIILDGDTVDLFCLSLNSAVSWGNRAIQLCAKLHGQCEIHAYCEGVDRGWLADLIEEAIDQKIFRPDAWGYDGWPKVIAFLRESDAEPVVTSYSVTDSFPNPSLAPAGALVGDLQHDDIWEAWGAYSEAQHWEWGMAALRLQPGLRISPETLSRYFGAGLTGREFMDRATALTKAEIAARIGAGE